MTAYNKVEGGVTAPLGFKACAVNAGIKSDKPDLAMVVSDAPAAAAGTFTTNKVQAAPVKQCKARVADGQPMRAVVINSGNANACTGAQGMADADSMADTAAGALGIDSTEVFICSTGCIGIPMPMDRVTAGIKAAAPALSPTGGDEAAKAIMTTDTRDKQVAVQIEIGGCQVTIGGMCKGAGMIEPNMATMLCVITTDAAVSQASLRKGLQAAVQDSFNKITVDGDMSTNDTVLFMANGLAGNDQLSEDSVDWQLFMDAVNAVLSDLAIMIAKDGEGATKFVTVSVTGAASDEDAYKAARAVANSMLVKTSWFGQDPNWGRVIDAVGYSGADVDEDLVEIGYDDLCAVKNGMAADSNTQEALEKVLQQKCFSVNIDLHIGDGSDRVYTCDCSHDYVSINADYTT